MPARIAFLIAVAIPFAVACGAARAAPPPPQQETEPRVVVLSNGEVLQGRVTRSDGLWIVDLPNGQIRLKNSDVELACADLEEGYRRKRALLDVGNVHQHLELAQWCLRHHLLGQAAVELADAATADPKHPMVGLLRRRLEMALAPEDCPDGGRRAATVGDHGTAPLASELAPSNDELDRMVRGMPRGAVEAFTQSVQPVLLNHCTNSGCHGPQSESGFRLHRIPKNTTSSRRVTQRNLYSVMQFVDVQNPSASRLLQAAAAPHGTVRQAVFAEHQAAQYQRLADWIARLAPQSAPTVSASEPPPAAPSAPAPPRLLTREAQRATRLPPADGQRDCPDFHRDHAKSGHGAKGTVPVADTDPADPFDPEVFNRRHAPGAAKPADSESP